MASRVDLACAARNEITVSVCICSGGGLRLVGLPSFSLDGGKLDGSYGDFVQQGFTDTGQGKGDLQIRICGRRAVQREFLPALGDRDSFH